MATPQPWPVQLQELLNETNFGLEVGDTTVRSDMDIGAQKVRRRFTKGIDSYTASINLTTDQYNVFRNFFDVTLNGGVNTFNYNDPITQVASLYRFKGTPKIISLGGGNFQASFVWEKMPQ